MKCYICDKELSEKEVNFNDDMKNFECCTTCLDIAMDAAYCDGFKIDEEDIQFVDEEWDNYGDDLLPNTNQRWPY